jgi:hypothetical protein
VRTELLEGVLGPMLLPASEAALKVQDRANTSVELVRVAAAIAEFRSAHGRYPVGFDELVPEILNTVPHDDNDNPFIYVRTDTGCLLYSLGVNAKDDGGSNSDLELHEGRPVAELSEADWRAAPKQGLAVGDDISIRVPRPAFAIPEVRPDE